MYSDGEIIVEFEAFLNRLWKENVYEMAVEYPDISNMHIDYFALANSSKILEDVIDNNPLQFLKCSEIALSQFEAGIEESLNNVIVRIDGYPFKTPIREIRHKHIMKMVCVEGTVRRVTDVRPKFKNVAFECLRCGDVTFVEQTLKKMIEPTFCNNVTCGKKGPFRIDYTQSEFTDFQVLEVQESFESLQGTQPRSIVVNVYDDMVDEVTAGDKIIVSGVLNISQKITNEGKATVSDIVLDSNNIERLDKSYDEIDISEEDLEDIKTLAANQNVKSMIVDSIAPSVYGYDSVKEALAMQLFSGIGKNLPDGIKIRGDIHVMLIGDPGTAKSQLVRHITTLSPRGVFNSGKSASGVGLTAAVVKDKLSDDRWVLEGGSLVMADNGLCAVDEMDKMRFEDVSALHEAMEQQTVTVSKAGIHAVLPTRCALVAAANPIHGRFDEYDTDIAGQINMSPTLLSRFDLIFIITDKPDKMNDLNIAMHISNNHVIGGMINNGADVTDELKKAAPPVKPELLRKYIAYSRTNIKPVLADDAIKLIESFYVEVRSMNISSNAIPITARKIDGLFRLAEASAKMRLSDVVEEQDAKDAIEIVVNCLKQVGSDEIDTDYFECGGTIKQQTTIRDLKKWIHDVKTFTLDDILVASGIDEHIINSYITRFKREGFIFKYDQKNYRIT